MSFWIKKTKRIDQTMTMSDFRNIKNLDLVFCFVYLYSLHDAGWSSLVARRAHNPKVIGSNPIPATIFFLFPFSVFSLFL